MTRRSRADIDQALSARDRTREFPCQGLRVGRLWLDQGFALELHPSQDPAEDGALLRLFLDFRLRAPEQAHDLLAHDHEALVPAFGLLGHHVERAFMTADAGFELHLDGGWILVAGSLDAKDYWDFEQPWPRVQNAHLNA